jgi:hypothetical protein
MMNCSRSTPICQYLSPVLRPLAKGKRSLPRSEGTQSVMTGTEEFPVLASLVISPNLQALLEFDDRLRTPSETHGRSGAGSADLTQSSQYPVWRQQEVPTISLPPPRRKKSVVAGVPVSPKASSECQRVSSSADDFPGVGEFGRLGEIVFASPEGVLEDEMELGPKGFVNPYLNSPPSPPRYFYPRSDDEEEGIIGQTPPFYTLERSRSIRRPVRKRSYGGDKSPLVERKGGKPVSPWYLTSLGCNVGSRPNERGKFFFFLLRSFLSLSISPFRFVFQSVGATCGTDKTAPLAQPHTFLLLLSLSPSMFNARFRAQRHSSRF